MPGGPFETVARGCFFNYDDDYDYDLIKGLSVALRLFKRPTGCLKDDDVLSPL